MFMSMWLCSLTWSILHSLNYILFSMKKHALIVSRDVTQFWMMLNFRSRVILMSSENLISSVPWNFGSKMRSFSLENSLILIIARLQNSVTMSNTSLRIRLALSCTKKANRSAMNWSWQEKDWTADWLSSPRLDIRWGSTFSSMDTSESTTKVWNWLWATQYFCCSSLI